ncbi:bifunctional AP-4-A phosphorylase/ADP sulfurylase [Hanseniaspora uvarum]|nr:bifunctional AP-4-A phosphorylase/ADP sulfurylase [Hanseniaspora uvarum]
MSVYPKTLKKTVTDIYNKAVSTGSVIKFESSSKFLKTSNSGEANLKYHLTFCDIDGQKPQKPEREDVVKEKFNPFLKQEPELTVLDNIMDNEYKLVLNKYPIVDEHLLLVTQKEIPQSSLLTPNDLNAAYKLLKTLQQEFDEDEEDDGSDDEDVKKSRYAVFYNCGPNSGFSIDHKHLQCIKLPNKLKTYQDFLVQEYPEPYIPNAKREPLEYEKVAYANFNIPLPKDLSKDDEYLVMCYVSLLQRSLSFFQQWDVEDPKERLPTSYSFIMTTDWMTIIPRSKSVAEVEFEEKKYTLGTNALGYLHMLLFKEEQKELYEGMLAKKDSTPVEDFLLNCGFPNNFSAAPAESDY